MSPGFMVAVHGPVSTAGPGWHPPLPTGWAAQNELLARRGGGPWVVSGLGIHPPGPYIVHCTMYIVQPSSKRKKKEKKGPCRRPPEDPVPEGDQGQPCGYCVLSAGDLGRGVVPGRSRPRRARAAQRSAEQSRGGGCVREGCSCPGCHQTPCCLCCPSVLPVVYVDSTASDGPR